MNRLIQYIALPLSCCLIFAARPNSVRASESAGQLLRVANTTLQLPPSAPVLGSPFPSTLLETGAFDDLETLTPALGIVPFDLNVPLWSDGARKTRWFSGPKTDLTIGFRREGHWDFPTGAVWIKHFELELTNGVPESAKRLETRFLVRTTNGVYGLTYRWGDSRTNAALVPEDGLNESFVIYDQGLTRTQVWRYPARAECLRCHNPAAGYALGFNTVQLNRDFNYGAGTANQIRALSEAGYFQTNVSELHTLRALAHLTNTAVSREYRVRSYLAANCAHCHQPSADCPTYFDPRITNSLSATRLINGLLMNNFGDPDNRVIKPGDTSHSVMLTRISTPGPRRMPPLATSLVDQRAIDLFTDWITNDLAHYQSFPDWQMARFGSTNIPQAAAEADADGDGASNFLEYLTGRDPWQAADAWRISVRPSNNVVQVLFHRSPNAGFEVQSTTNLVASNSWKALDVPANQPFFSATEGEAVLEDAVAAGSTKFYRVRVFEP